MVFITNGLVRSSDINSVGGIPYAPSSHYGANEQVGQVGMSSLIMHEFMGIEDIAADYSIRFWMPTGAFCIMEILTGRR